MVLRDSAPVPPPERTQIKFLGLPGFSFIILLISFVPIAKLHAQIIEQCCGPFVAGANYAVPEQGQLPAPSQNQLAVGDLNGDGRHDVVIANQDGTVSILLGNGDGTLQPQYTVTAVPSSSSFLAVAVAIGDFNNDGHADLAVLCVSTVSPPEDSRPTGTVIFC